MNRTERLIRTCIASTFTVIALLMTFTVPASRELAAGNSMMFVVLAIAAAFAASLGVTAALMVIRATR